MPIFFNFVGIAGDHTQDALNDSFLKIDTDFIKLSSAETTSAFVKIEDGGQFKHDISVIGGGFLKLSEAFHKIDVVAEALDAFVLKIAPPPTTVPTLDAAVVSGVPAVQDDFLKLDEALKIHASDLGTLAADWQKLDTAPDLRTWKVDLQNVSLDFQKLSTDASNTADAYKILGGDLVALGSGDNANSLKLNEALKLLGGELLKVAPAFDALAFDWHKISQDVASEAGGGGTIGTALTVSDATHPQPTGVLGTDFVALDKDFLLLNQALGGTIPGTVKLLGALFDQAGLGEHKVEVAEHLLGGHGGSDHG